MLKYNSKSKVKFHAAPLFPLVKNKGICYFTGIVRLHADTPYVLQRVSSFLLKKKAFRLLMKPLLHSLIAWAHNAHNAHKLYEYPI